MRLELTNTGFAVRRLSRLATRASLERKERFELSSRVWKTRMFPATSLPQVGAQVSGEAPAPSSWGEIVRLQTNTDYTEKSWSVFVCVNLWSKWSGRTELNCHHECPRLGCLRYTTPRKIGAPGETRTHSPLLKRQVP